MQPNPIPILTTVFVLTLTLAMPAYAQQASGRALLTQFMQEVQTLRADFEQSLLDERGYALEHTSGTMALKRPGRFRWHYTKPYEQLIVADGERVWVYDKDLEQVTVRDQEQGLDNAAAMLLSGRAGLEEQFVIEEGGHHDGYTWVSLRARRSEAEFSTAELAFEGETLRVMRLEDNFGQTTRLTFSEVERNPELSNALFTFTPPEGVDVVGDVARSH